MAAQQQHLPINGRHHSEARERRPTPREPWAAPAGGVEGTWLKQKMQTAGDKLRSYFRALLHVSTSTDRGIVPEVQLTEIVEVVDNGLQRPMPHQDGQGNAHAENNTQILSQVNLVKALWLMALVTMSMVIATALYKPARGVIFGPNKVAYYITLATIFLSGVAEAFTAFWVPRSRDANDRHRNSVGRAVLCASLGPFVAILGIGGFAFIEG